MRIMGLALLSIAAATVLAGCASIPLKTVYNLWNFDPWTSDFRVWRAAVRVPEGRGLSLDTARVQMKVETWRDGDAARQAETFILERSHDAADLAPLGAEARPGFAVAAYRFSAMDHARLEGLRVRIVTARKSGQPQKGALSISAASCGAGTVVPDGAVLFSTYLMVEPKDGYNPLVVDYDIAPELRTALAKGTPTSVCLRGQ